MKHKSKNTKRKLDLSVFKRKSASWIFALILLGLHVFYAVQTSALGARIALYEEELQTLERETESLSLNLVNSTSLTSISQISENLGFQKIDNTLYIQLGESFAQAR
jgi:hypothetical protein